MKTLRFKRYHRPARRRYSGWRKCWKNGKRGKKWGSQGYCFTNTTDKLIPKNE